MLDLRLDLHLSLVLRVILHFRLSNFLVKSGCGPLGISTSPFLCGDLNLYGFFQQRGD